MMKRKDAVLGRIIFTSIVVITILAIGFFWYLGYWATNLGSSEKTSIAMIGRTPDVTTSVSPETPKATTTESAPKGAPTPVAVQKETLAIVVLNGGAPKGSAANLAEALKADGFKKAVTGNSSGDYSGLVVYRADGNDAAAEAVRKTLSVKYPTVSVKPADPKNVETTKATITIIFGK